MSDTAYTLVIGSRNFSSWSLRGWLAMKLSGAPFAIEHYDLRGPQREELKRVSPSALVPLLKVRRADRAFVIWDSLAISEYLAEQHPAALLWPADPSARAWARSVTAEMHSGFADLRHTCPVDIVARVAGHPITAETRAQIDRILRIWTECRGTFAGGGDFLFGPVTIADCFYAPVATRFRTYGVALDGAAKAYAEAVLAWPAVQEWSAEARREEELRARSR